ncbi:MULTISPECIES: hypothetical protein [Psychrobacter]|uniref:hypothetical protein n=1 Tax=Psychrobacter TaxID=497 RepID=UPI00191A6F23|nr:MULTISPECIES: hypothetical protein [unclassified Psychrobacter]MDA5132272.1 hypothetical protein [Psychrobacter sp. ANT_H3]
MNKITANVGLTKARQALWIALFASIVGVTACSNEREDVAADSTEVADEVAVDEASEEGTEVVETGMTADGMSGNDGEQKADDTVTVNESNANLDQTPADGVQ